jgi:hypothetical protein
MKGHKVINATFDSSKGIIKSFIVSDELLYLAHLTIQVDFTAVILITRAKF